MDRKEFVLTAMAAADRGAHTPVQIQKLLFLLDRNVPDAFEGPHFNFQPYDYGPFDQAVYATLDELAQEGLVEIDEPGRSWRRYRLTDEGQQRGDGLLVDLDGAASNYLQRASQFVRSLSFSQLVSAIYKKYPEMKENSVFKE